LEHFISYLTGNTEYRFPDNHSCCTHVALFKAKKTLLTPVKYLLTASSLSPDQLLKKGGNCESVLQSELSMQNCVIIIQTRNFYWPY